MVIGLVEVRFIGIKPIMDAWTVLLAKGLLRER